jgi:hypothetical protein
MIERAAAGLPLFHPQDNLVRDATSAQESRAYERGVYYSPSRRRYRATASVGGKRKFLGWFYTAELAARAIARARDDDT